MSDVKSTDSAALAGARKDVRTVAYILQTPIVSASRVPAIWKFNKRLGLVSIVSRYFVHSVLSIVIRRGAVPWPAEPAACRCDGPGCVELSKLQFHCWKDSIRNSPPQVEPRNARMQASPAVPDLSFIRPEPPTSCENFQLPSSACSVFSPLGMNLGVFASLAPPRRSLPRQKDASPHYVTALYASRSSSNCIVPHLHRVARWHNSLPCCDQYLGIPPNVSHDDDAQRREEHRKLIVFLYRRHGLRETMRLMNNSPNFKAK